MARELSGVTLYLAAMVGAILIFNRNADSWELALAIWVIASLLLGALYRGGGGAVAFARNPDSDSVW